jgi:hypothetical protein
MHFWKCRRKDEREISGPVETARRRSLQADTAVR